MGQRKLYSKRKKMQEKKKQGMISVISTRSAHDARDCYRQPALCAFNPVLPKTRSRRLSFRDAEPLGKLAGGCSGPEDIRYRDRRRGAPVNL